MIQSAVIFYKYLIIIIILYKRVVVLTKVKKNSLIGERPKAEINKWHPGNKATRYSIERTLCATGRSNEQDIGAKIEKT